MKKLLLCLSVMASAALSASAFDHFTAGTDDAPNYYVIRSNRGTPYLSYSADELNNGSVATQLYRSTDVSEYSLWAVTPGSVSGTVVIKNYKADAYLMGFKTGDGSDFTGVSGATADVISTPEDIYIRQFEDNAFAMSLHSEAGFQNVEGGSIFFCLDASGGNNFCGNWWATNSGGTMWWATKVDISNGDNVADVVAQVQLSIEVELAKEAALAQLTPFVDLEFVADIIADGIDKVNAVEVAEGYQTKINDAVSSTIAEANSTIQTCLGGKIFGLKNLRRAASNRTDAYVSVDVTIGNYPGAANMLSPNTIFEFQPIDGGGYHMYNKATSTYLSTALKPVADVSEAQAIYPVINTFGDYTGFSIVYSANPATNAFGFNFDLNGNALVSWYYDWDAAGSIWSFVEYDEQTIKDEATATYVSHLEAYAANVEPAADVFTAAIASIKALELSENIATEAAALETKAIADANEYLATALNEKSVELRNLRNGYIIPNAEATAFSQGEDVDPIQAYGYSVSATASDAADFNFMSAADGGYTVYSPVTERYLGPGLKNGGNTSMTQVEEESEALVVTPQVASAYNQAGAVTYYGVGFTFVAGTETRALNTNGAGMHSWYIDDAGSIFAIKVVGDATQISEITAAPAAQGIYDLSGRRLAAPVRGINIINGRKVLVK